MGTPGSVAVIGIGTTVNGGNTAVVFHGLEQVHVDVADGDDAVFGIQLAASAVNVYTGGGDDRVELFGTSGGPVGPFAPGDGLSLFIQGDTSTLSPTTTNGDDSLERINNIYVSAALVGGAGADRLWQRSNVGLMTVDGFELA